MSGRQVHCRVGLHIAIGDTPAAGAIGGFKEGVGLAKNKCRMCICTDYKMQRCFRETDFELADLETHKDNCTQLEAAKNKTTMRKISATCGINRRSEIMKCPEFDVTKGMPMDVMHVMQEGVIEYEVKCVLKYFIEDKQFTLKDFNDALDAHFQQFRKESFDQPNEIKLTVLHSNDNKLHQSASKMYTLTRAMPFLLDKLVKEKTEKNKEYILLVQEVLQITNFMFSPVVAKDRIEVMVGKIEQHLKRFKKLFPNNRIIPKQHYMIHIPRNILQFGPAYKYSTARFESEHRPHKRHIVHQENYKNVSLSIVRSAQYSNAVEAESEKGEHPFFKKELVFGKVEEVPEIKQVIMKRKLEEAYPKVAEENFKLISTANTAEVCGEKYVVGYSFVAVGIEGSHLQFGKVHNIILIQTEERPDFTQVVLEVCPYTTIGLDQKLQSYKIEKPGYPVDRKLVVVEDLIDYKSYDSCLFKKSIYLALFYEVEGLIKLVKDVGHAEHHNQLHRRGRY